MTHINNAGVKSLLNQLKRLVNSQYGNPRGILGRVIGEKMVVQHLPETLWTINILEPEENDTVLELGCGAGKAIELVSERLTTGRTIGIDRSPALVKSATLRNRENIASGSVEIKKADVASLPIGDSEVDKVFSIHSIYFWTNLDQAMSEIFRVIRVGGRVILTLSDGTVEEKNEAICNGIHNSIVPAMSKAGFQEISFERGPNSRQFLNLAIVGIKKTTGHHLEQV